MIPDLDSSMVHVLAAYGVASVLVAALVIHTLVKARKSTRMLREAEKRENG